MSVNWVKIWECPPCISVYSTLKCMPLGAVGYLLWPLAYHITHSPTGVGLSSSKDMWSSLSGMCRGISPQFLPNLLSYVSFIYYIRTSKQNSYSFIIILYDIHHLLH